MIRGIVYSQVIHDSNYILIVKFPIRSNVIFKNPRSIFSQVIRDPSPILGDHTRLLPLNTCVVRPLILIPVVKLVGWRRATRLYGGIIIRRLVFKSARRVLTY